MATMKKILAGGLATCMLLMSGILASAADTTNSIEIDLTEQDALAKYFTIPAANQGEWSIVDGVLTQTVGHKNDSLDSTPGQIAPADTSQLITLKGQNLKDFTLEFSMINQDYNEYLASLDIDGPGQQYSRATAVAFNVKDPNQFAMNGSNPGMAFVYQDPVSYGGAAPTAKAWTLYDTGVTPTGQPAFNYGATFGMADYPNIVDGATNPEYAKVDGLNYKANYPDGAPEGATMTKLACLESNGKHYYKIVKEGNNYQIYTKVPAAEAQENNTYNESRLEGTNPANAAQTGIEFFPEEYVLIAEYTDADNTYNEGGAIQFIAMNGIAKFADIKVTSPQLDVTKFVVGEDDTTPDDTTPDDTMPDDTTPDDTTPDDTTPDDTTPDDDTTGGTESSTKTGAETAAVPVAMMLLLASAAAFAVTLKRKISR